jgi:hypothetical protein
MDEIYIRFSPGPITQKTVPDYENDVFSGTVPQRIVLYLPNASMSF